MKDNDVMDPVQEYMFRAKIVRWLIGAVLCLVVLIVLYLICYGF